MSEKYIETHSNIFEQVWELTNTVMHFIVKQVSWLKSSLLLRIQIKYTHELQFIIKTKDSIFNQTVYTTDEKRVPSMAWLGLVETDSILIKKRSVNTYLKHWSGCLEMFFERKHLRFE
jgi:hypothetical protein